MQVREFEFIENFIILPLAGVQQCIREGKTIGMNGNDNLTELNEGCRVHGHLEVNKVAGNFHIAPGQSFQEHHVHVHSLKNIRLNALNTTHSIEELAFGRNFPGQINPLSQTKQISNSRDGAAILYHYYVKVVPSTYVFLNQTQLITNQYSVTKHRKTIKNIFDSSDHQLPGTFFTYEISAIMVKFVEQKRSLAQFLTSLCAIIVRARLLPFASTFLHSRVVFSPCAVCSTPSCTAAVVCCIKNST